MPREQITETRMELRFPSDGSDGLPPGDRIEPYLGGPNKGGTIDILPELHIGWENGSHIQASIRVRSDHLLRIADEFRASAEHGPENLPAWFEFVTPVLSRAEAQRLIVTTRRARNAVFDADE